MKDKKKSGGNGAGPDPRFAAVQYDPRFQRFPKAKSKVQVDDRFKGMFEDPAFQVGVTVDKRGRKSKGKKRTEDMRRYYRLEDEDEWKKEQKDEKSESEEEKEEEELAVADKKGKKKVAPVGKKKGGKKEESSSEEEVEQSESEDEDSEEESGGGSEEEDDEAAQRWARMRGLAGPETSSEEESSDNDDTDKSDVSDEDDVSDSEMVPDAEEESLDLEANDDEAIKEFGIGAMAANPREQIDLLPDATSRLACVDLDWENIRAIDILVALRSFLPRGGTIKKVTVYPSDYGLERMEAEAKSGPQGIWKQAKKNMTVGGDGGGDRGSDDDDEKSSDSEDEEDEEEQESSDDDSAADGEVDPAKLRLYERSKLRWYYAIVECDSTESANQLYEECDGMELMKSACKFDLRFVPDEQSFEGRKVRDSAVEVPSDYEAPTFQTKALQHTNVDLTWDKGDESRKRALTRKLTAEEIKEDDFRAYLATESEESSDAASEDDAGGDKDDAEAIRERYRRLLLGGGGDEVAKERKGKKDWKKGSTGDSDGSDSENDSAEEDGDEDKKMEMEVTFTSGLEGLGDRLVAKRKEAEAKAGETVWEAYMRRKKEKKAEAKRLGKVNYDSEDDEGDYSEEEGSEGGSGSDEDLPAGVADDPFFQHEEDPFSDPFFQSGGAEASVGGKKDKKKSKKGAAGEEEEGVEEARRRKAELEMLLMDEDALLRAGNGAEATINGTGKSGGKLSKKERMRLKKEKKRSERAHGSDDEDHEEAVGAGFKVNLEDPRFKDLLVAPEFALDPTDPRYAKAGPGVAVVAAEVAKRRSKAVGTKKSAEKSVEKLEKGGNGAAGGSSKADLKLMVASLKRKAAAMGPGEGGSSGQGKGKKAAKRR